MRGANAEASEMPKPGINPLLRVYVGGLALQTYSVRIWPAASEVLFIDDALISQINVRLPGSRQPK